METTSHVNSITRISLAEIEHLNYESIDDSIYAVAIDTMPQHIQRALSKIVRLSDCPGDGYYWRHTLDAARAIKKSILKFHLTKKKCQ